MDAIMPNLQDNVFDPADIRAMSIALEEVCTVLNVREGNPARDELAKRIVTLARQGECNPPLLRDRLLKEAGLAE
jgi:hypothetical protein